MKNKRKDFAVFGDGIETKTGYIFEHKRIAIGPEQRIKFESSCGKIFFPKKKQIHTVFPA